MGSILKISFPFCKTDLHSQSSNQCGQIYMYQDLTATLNFATVKEVITYSRQLILNCLRVAKALFFFKATTTNNWKLFPSNVHLLQKTYCHCGQKCYKATSRLENIKSSLFIPYNGRIISVKSAAGQNTIALWLDAVHDEFVDSWNNRWAGFFF